MILFDSYCVMDNVFIIHVQVFIPPGKHIEKFSQQFQVFFSSFLDSRSWIVLSFLGVLLYLYCIVQLLQVLALAFWPHNFGQMVPPKVQALFEGHCL